MAGPAWRVPGKQGPCGQSGEYGGNKAGGQEEGSQGVRGPRRGLKTRPSGKESGRPTGEAPRGMRWDLVFTGPSRCCDESTVGARAEAESRWGAGGWHGASRGSRKACGVRGAGLGSASALPVGEASRGAGLAALVSV